MARVGEKEVDLDKAFMDFVAIINERNSDLSDGADEMG
jgi:hypothetical protein